jgi:hypothetical protein
VVAVRKGLRVLGALVLMAVAGSSLALPARAEGRTKTYGPPYKNGPQGGDPFNHFYRDENSGTIGIARTYPGVPPVVGCTPEPSAGWSMFRIRHRVTGPVPSVTIDFEGSFDPYTWVTGGVRDARGNWLGVGKLQGPHAGEGRLRIRLFDRPARTDRITVEFGLQLGDACPQVGGGLVEFSSVKVGARR